MNIAKLKRILVDYEQKKKIHGWKIIFIDEEKNSAYLTKNNELETTIESSRTQAEITIYVKVAKKLGEASFMIFSEEDLITVIDDNIKLAKLAKNNYYELPDKKNVFKKNIKRADKEIINAFEKNVIEKKTLKLFDELTINVKKEKKIKLSAAEIIISHKKRRIINNKKLDQKDNSTSAYIEAVLTSFEKKGNKINKEQEYLANKKVVRLKDLDIKEFVKENSIIARDILVAENLQGAIVDNILLRGEALREYFAPNLGLNPLVFHASAKIKNMKLSRYVKNKVVTSNNMTIISNPDINFNVASNYFDRDGVSSQKVKLIEKGIFKNYFSSKQYADYENLEATGELGVIEIKLGNNNPDDLRKIAKVEIVAFSSFTPNSVSGDFSAEIRLAYLYKGNKRIPVRAAMFSGNIFKVQHHLSNKEIIDQGYKGPDLIMLNEVSLNGI